MALDISSDPTDVSLAGLYGGGGDLGSTLAGSDASDYYKRQDSSVSPDQYLASLTGVGAGMAEQPNANWMRQNPESNPNFYANLYELLGSNGSRSGVDWSKLGYSGPGVTETSGYRDSGGDYVTPSSPWNVPDSWKQFVDTNKLGLNTGQNDQGFQLSQLTKNGQIIPGANYSYALANNDAFNITQAIVNAGLGYGIGAAAGAGSAAAGAGASGGTATGTGFEIGSLGSATAGGGAGGGAGLTLGAGAGAGGGTGLTLGGVNAGLGASGGFSLGTLGQQAGRGALTNAGSTALQGGDWNDILKSAGRGAVGGAIGYGVGSTNLGSYLTDNPNYQSIVNRGVTGGLNAGVNGGNVGMGALWGAGQQAGNVAGNAAWNSFNSPSGMGGNVPDYYSGGMFDAQPGGIDAFAQQGQPSPYWNAQEQGGYGGNFGGGETPTGNAYMPDYSGGQTASNTPSGNQSNPAQDMMSKILGFSNGNAGNSPKFGDMAGSLLGMYNAYQQKKKYGQLAESLSSMYGPNSPYAQQLQQQLMRRDAAAGRRSQYGPREVELQARLADVNSRMAPTLQSLYGAQGQQGNALLNNGLRFGQQSGLTGMLGNYIGQNAMPWINSMFNQTPANSGPQFEG